MRMLALAAAAVVSIWGTAAAAKVVTFDGPGAYTNITTDVGPAYPAACCQIISNIAFYGVDGGGWGVFSKNNPDRPTPDNAAMAIYGPGGLRMGLSFGPMRTLAFDLAEFSKTTASDPITVVLELVGGGEETHVLNLDGVAGLQTFDFSASGPVDWFRISGPVQIDNIAYERYVAGVPEPSTWAMIILGFGVAGGAMRRRRSRSMRVSPRAL